MMKKRQKTKSNSYKDPMIDSLFGSDVADQNDSNKFEI